MELENEKLNYFCGVCGQEFLSEITPDRIKKVFVGEYGVKVRHWICPECKKSNPDIKTI